MCSGCCHRIPQPGWLINGWKLRSQFWILEILGRGLPLGAWWRPTGDIFTRQSGECGLTGKESLDEGSRPLRVSLEIWGSRPTPRLLVLSASDCWCKRTSTHMFWQLRLPRHDRPCPSRTMNQSKSSLPEVTLARVFCTATERKVTTRLSYYMVLLLPPTSYNLTS